MRVNFCADHLKDLLSVVSRVTATRTPIDALKYVHVKAAGNVVTLTGSSGAVVISCIVEGARVDETGECLADPVVLRRLLGSASDDSLVMSSDNGRCQVSYADAEYDLKTPSADTYPVADLPEVEPMEEVPAADLAKVIRRALPYVSETDARYSLGGINFVIGKEAIRAESTCNVALSVHHLATCDAPKREQVRGSVPTKAVQTVQAMCQRPDADGAGMYMDIRRSVFWAGGFRLDAQLIEGRFPKTEVVLSQVLPHGTKFEPQVLLDAVKQAIVIQDPENKALELTFGNEGLNIQYKSQEQGSTNLSVPAIKSPAAASMFNGSFLSSILSGLVQEDQADLAYSDGSFRVDQDGSTYVLAGIQVK